VRNQRNSWHGIDFPYHGTLDVAEYYRRYGETLLSVDDSIGRVMDVLAERGWLESTVIVYMGDNGFAFGEHGLIDKRTAYETSMRVPMLMHCPQLFPGGKTVTEVVANLDIAPTLLSAAGLTAPATMVGRDMLPLAQGRRVPWRDALLYEYYWERNFPQTPTTFALRDARYKFIRYHGLWDVDEFFDLEADPAEMRNLIDDRAHDERARAMSARLFAVLAETNGLSIPLWPDRAQSRVIEDGSTRGPFREQQNLRSPGATRAADFPPALIAPPAR
jgi:N-acetylglucosamine-6-sulfatase